MTTNDNSYYVNCDRVAGEEMRDGPGQSQKESLGPPQAPQATPPALAVTHPPLMVPRKSPLAVPRETAPDPSRPLKFLCAAPPGTQVAIVRGVPVLASPSTPPRIQCNTCGEWVSLPGPGETIFHDCHLEGVTADPGRCPVCSKPWPHCECPEMPDRLAGDGALTCPYRSTGGAVRAHEECSEQGDV